MTLYDQVKDRILAKIKDGTYAVGDTIPSELELAEQYDVSRATIRQAVQILVSKGYLEKRRRRGTIVTEPKINQSFTMTISSFEDAMRLAGRMPRTKALLFKREQANRSVAQALELAHDEEVYKLVRLRYADETPNVFVESYIPTRLYPSLDQFDFNQTSLYEAMEQCGSRIMTANRRMEAINADGPTAALLDIEDGEALMLFHTVARNAAGEAAEYSIATYRGKSNTFEINVSRG